MFWMKSKENNFPICTLIWRPGIQHQSNEAGQGMPFTHRIGSDKNANTIYERRSKMVRNRVFEATNGNQKHCFYRFLIRVRRLLRAFSIAACPV